MDVLVYVIGILLAVFALAILGYACYDVITSELEKRKQEKANEGYIVTEYMYKGEVVYCTRTKDAK